MITQHILVGIRFPKIINKLLNKNIFNDAIYVLFT